MFHLGGKSDFEKNKDALEIISKMLEILDRFEKKCKIEYKKNKGWVNKLYLWGIYDGEIINIQFYQPIINLVWKINVKS